MGKINRSRQIKLLQALQAKANEALTLDARENFRYLSDHLKALQAIIDKVNAEFTGAITVTTQAKFAGDLPALIETVTSELEALLDEENLGNSSSSSSSDESGSSNSNSSASNSSNSSAQS